MSGSAQMSTTFHDREPAASDTNRMSIALIGPNNSHRRTVAKALAGTGAKAVREFEDYPATLGDVPSLMEQNFDVVMIDVDSDQSYALALIETMSNWSKTVVIAYSQRNDPNLATNCVQAGARELLPLPDDSYTGAGSQEQTATGWSEPAQAETRQPQEESPTHVPDLPSAAAQQPAPQPKEARPAPPPVDFSEWDNLHLRPLRAASGKIPEPGPRLAVAPKPSRNSNGRDKNAPLRITPANASPVETATDENPQKPVAVEVPSKAIKVESPAPEKQPPTEKIQKSEPTSRRPEPAGIDGINDKRAWDKLWARTTPMTDVAAPENAPGTEEGVAPSEKSEENWENVWARTAAPVVTRVPEEQAHPEPPAEPAAVPDLWLDAIEAEAQSPQSRVKTIEVPIYRYVEPDENQHHRGGSHLVILAMGLGVLVCLLWVYFMHPFGQKFSVDPHPQTVAAQPVTKASDPRTVSSDEKPTPGSPNPDPSVPVQPSAPEPVSSQEMDAQLAAPAKIADTIKKPVAPEGPPPAGVAPDAMETASMAPGAVFGSEKQVRVVPVAQSISEGVAAGMLIHKTPPVYPEFAKQGHVTGTVVLGATISKTGTIQNLRVLSGPEVLRAAAMDAVKTWRYRPYMLDNQPVAVDTTIKLVFSMGQQ